MFAVVLTVPRSGCGALCPNGWQSSRFLARLMCLLPGTIPPGEGNRFVLAATDHLRQKLARMEARMHSLEDALSILHGTESGQSHPLLVAQESEDDDYPPEEEQSTLNLKAISEEPSQQESSLVDALGSLHIDGEGASRFFGPSGGAEVSISIYHDYSLRLFASRVYYWRVTKCCTR